MGDPDFELFRISDAGVTGRVVTGRPQWGQRILCFPTSQYIKCIHVNRLESANMRSKAGRGKVFGTVVCVGGAMLLTLYKGIPLTNTSHSQAVAYNNQPSSLVSHQKAHRWTVGSILMLGACVCWSSWFLLQAKIGESFPAPYSSTTVVSFMSCLQSAVLSLAIKRDISLWALKGAFRIATVIYAVSIA